MPRNEVNIKLTITDDLTDGIRASVREASKLTTEVRKLGREIVKLSTTKNFRKNFRDNVVTPTKKALKNLFTEVLPNAGRESARAIAKSFAEGNKRIRRDIEKTKRDILEVARIRRAAEGVGGTVKRFTRVRQARADISSIARVSAAAIDTDAGGFSEVQRKFLQDAARLDQAELFRKLGRRNFLNFAKGLKQSFEKEIRPSINELAEAQQRLIARRESLERALGGRLALRGLTVSIIEFSKRSIAALREFGSSMARTLGPAVRRTVRVVKQLIRVIRAVGRVLLVVGRIALKVARRFGQGLARGVLLARGAMGSLLSMARSLVLPLSILGGAAAFGIFRLGKSIVQTTARFENFRLQLRAIVKDTVQAEREFANIRQAAVVSPLTTEEFVSSFVRLRAVGIQAAGDVTKALANVAVVFNRDLRDVASAFIGVETEVLRRLGILLVRSGRKAVVQAGKTRLIVQNDVETIRRAILRLIKTEIPNAQAVIENSLTAQFKVLTSLIQEVFSDIGEVIRLDLLAGLKDVNEFITRMRPTIRAFASALFKDFDKLKEALKDFARNLIRATNTNLKQFEDAFGDTFVKLIDLLRSLMSVFIDIIAVTSKVIWNPLAVTLRGLFSELENEFFVFLNKLTLGTDNIVEFTQAIFGGGTALSKFVRNEALPFNFVAETANVGQSLIDQAAFAKLKAQSPEVTLLDFLRKATKIPADEVKEVFDTIVENQIKSFGRFRTKTREELRKEQAVFLKGAVDDMRKNLNLAANDAKRELKNIGRRAGQIIRDFTGFSTDAFTEPFEQFRNRVGAILEDRRIADVVDQLEKLEGALKDRKNLRSQFTGLGILRNELKTLPDLMAKVNTQILNAFGRGEVIPASLIKRAEELELLFERIRRALEAVEKTKAIDTVAQQIRQNRENFTELREEFFSQSFGTKAINDLVRKSERFRNALAETLITADKGRAFSGLINKPKDVLEKLLQDVKEVQRTALEIFDTRDFNVKFSTAFINRLDRQLGGELTKIVDEFIRKTAFRKDQVRETFETLRRAGGRAVLIKQALQDKDVVARINERVIKARLDAFQLPRLLQTISQTSEINFRKILLDNFELFLRRPSGPGRFLDPSVLRDRLSKVSQEFKLFLEQLNVDSAAGVEIINEVLAKFPEKLRPIVREMLKNFDLSFLVFQSEQATKKAKQNLDGFAKRLADLGAKTRETANQQRQFGIAEQIIQSGPKAREALQSIIEQFDPATRGAAEFRAEIVKLIEGLDQAERTRLLGIPRTQQSAFLQQFQSGRVESVEGFKQGPGEFGGQTREESFLFGASQAIEELEAKFRNFASTAKELIGVMTEGLSGRLASALTNIITGVQTAQEAFKNFAQALLSDITRIIIKFIALKAITLALSLATGGAGGLLGGINLGGFAKGGVAPRSIDTSTATPVRAFANGGVTTQPTVALFGERQPEAFVPLPDGRTIPVTLKDQQQNQPTTSVVINIQAADAQSFQQMLEKDPGLLGGVLAKQIRNIPGVKGSLLEAFGA